MTERLSRKHSSSRNMSSRASASWRKFHVLPSGGSCAAQVQEELIQRLTYRGHQRVNHPQDCDYYLVFCPISSRVGTDISESERNIPGDKPAVLVVLHHTFNPQYVFRRSKLLVTKANVVLTVDMLFHQGALLRCSTNDQAWALVETFIWDSSSSRWRCSCETCCTAVCVLILIAAAIGLCICVMTYTGVVPV